ncbi:hypothetical protein ABY59_0200001 [Enterobacter phage phiEap-2]|uniref:hypothetical protein n=1 Tax=Enterobacter phage phiEap-2 TaxID=1701257 RepID=UPI0006BE0659|nr:hypothetical protein ABY59_0200001 [Enterobacter phage phiEap-2]ALA45568.1 hypothetical protein ABY59_0200001 [Enterobacter phage phiEap-2]
MMVEYLREKLLERCREAITPDAFGHRVPYEINEPMKQVHKALAELTADEIIALLERK